MESGICQPPTSEASSALADVAPALYQRYFDAFPGTFLTQHHMESYEAFMFRTMPQVILSENPITDLKEPLDESGSVYKYKTEIFVGGEAKSVEDLAIDVGAPIITLDDGKTVRRMFPNEARIRDLTYATTIRADILIRLTLTEPSAQPGQQYTSTVHELKIDQFPLFRIPTLIRSKLCATYGASQALLTEMGECRNDHGGYFMVDGAEKLLITRQEQAFNTVIVSLKPPHDLKVNTYASVVCQHPKTKHTRRVTFYRLHASGSVEEGAIRVSIPTVKGAIPLFVLFRALGVESDEDIVRMILPDTSAASTKTMENTLIASIHDAYPITTTVHAIEFIRTLTKGFIVANVLHMLHEYLFSHVPDKPLARAQYLAEIVRKMIRVEMGMEPQTNRDDIRNQRLLPTGSLLLGLFSESWKDWKKSVKLEVGKQYNYNKSLYQGTNYLNIFSAGNISKVLSTGSLNDSIMRGFRGKWGTNPQNTKTGVIQPVARISYLDSMSHTRRVVSDFDTSMKLTGPRHLHTSQVGYFCTAETPTGSHIGATKNMSILTAISIYAEYESLMNWLFSRGKVIDVSAAPTSLAATATSVQINGGTIGFSTQPDLLTRTLKLMKWTACLPPTASISFNTADNIVRIYLDDGRPIRPLWHLQAGGKWPRIMLEAQAGTKSIPSWRDLVCGTYPMNAGRGIYSADFVDPLADKESVDFIDYETELSDFMGAIEYIDPYEGNESYVSWWGNVADLSPEHTHAEIHPSSLMGLLGSMIPFANHNQSPRNQLSCSQSKQGIGYYATNYENRFDTYGSMLCYGEGALCRTIVHEAVAGGQMPYGTNVIFCLNSFNGYNQDDGILFNRSSIERGLFRSLALRSYSTVEEEDPITKARYRIGNPRNILAWSDLAPGNDYSQLDEYGVIKEGVVIHDKTVLVGRYLTNPETGKLSDASLLPTVFTRGRVDKVVVLHQANGLRLVRIRILEERVPELGDKFSSRHGQKGTMGMLLDAIDMPRTADGLVPDVVVNPHCIPSRMTIAQILEQVFGKLGAAIGSKMNATSFMNDEQSFNAIADALQQIGLQREGEEILYSGMTGKMYSTSVFMAPLYFMRLKHLTQDKQNSRAAGRKEIRTHQPTGGRGNEGGMRIGEMERDTLIAHGGAAFLQESMMKRSDGTSFWVCNGCGTIPLYNEDTKLFLCPTCDGPVTYQGDTTDTLGLVLPVRKSRTTFSRIEIPYALKLLDQELTTFMNAGFRFLTEKNSRQFREPTEMGVEEVLETQEKEEEKKNAPAIEEAIDKAMAQMTKIATMPVMVDRGDEDAPADLIDEGQPAHNDNAAPAEVPAGVPVIEFSSQINTYKEFGTYYPVKLTIGEKVWPSVEHYFQAQKFPDNPDYQETIRVAKTSAQAKRLGKTTTIAIRPNWDTYRDEVMLAATREKFSDAHPVLKQKLLSTGNAVLNETSPLDNYWGLGRKRLGQNKLGRILMQVREELKTATMAPTVDADAGLTKEQVRVDVLAEEAALQAQQPQMQPQLQQQIQTGLPTISPPDLVGEGQGPVLQINEVDAAEIIPGLLETQAPQTIPEHNPRGKVSWAPEATGSIEGELVPEDSDIKVVTINAPQPVKK